MLEKFLDKILDEDEDLGEEIKEEVKEEIEEIKEAITKERKFTWGEVLPPFFLFLLAFGVRLAFMLLNDPQSPGYGWYGDVYHHWQIAYLTKIIGLKHGFLRLWDLKGMEFYWGLMHPLILIILFTLTSSINIVVSRLLSIFCGSLVVVFIYFLIKRHFSRLIAFICGLWTALFSVVLFSDTLGMQEQLGLVFLFGGLLAWPSWGFLSGILWALASMVRAEYWLFGFALVLAAFFDPRKKMTDKKVFVFFGYLIPIVLYMKYMQHYTGHAIFPIYLNYRASVVGDWFTNVDVPLSEIQVLGQWFGRGLFALGFIGTILSLWKRPKYYLFLLLGFFNVTFIGFIFGFAAYIHGFFERFWVDRLLAFPYLFLGILIILFFLGWLPNRFPRGRKMLMILGLIVFVLILSVSQLAWGKIMHYFRIAQAPYETELKIASFIAENDIEGKMVFLSDRPALTYALVKNYHFSGERLISDMYDPYYYATGDESPEELEEVVIEWMEREKINMVVHSAKKEYDALIENYPKRFKFLGRSENVSLYEFLQ